METGSAHEWAREIRAWLLGRLAKEHGTGPIPKSLSTRLLYPPILAWWVLEGKSYEGIPGSLCRNFDLIERWASRLFVSYNPTWRTGDAPEGETDWIASSFSTLTSGRQTFVSRSTGVGLGELEYRALVGWLEWLRSLWTEYIERLGVPDGCEGEVPWRVRPLQFEVDDHRTLRSWAHTARRSRWPLLRMVAAESLRAALEPEDLDKLPLPSDRATLFELICMVRILRTIEPQPRAIKWLNLDLDDNSVCMPGLKYQFQHALTKDSVLSTHEFDHGLREAMERQSIRCPKLIDGWLEFTEPVAGWSGVLVEAKSGDQGPDAAIHQLKCYRAALHTHNPDPILVLGVCEREVDQSGLDVALQQLRENGHHPTQDFWVFCSLDDIPEVLHAARITPNDQSLLNILSRRASICPNRTSAKSSR